MSLQAKLDAFKIEFEAQTPKAANEAFRRSIQELIDNGSASRALQAGQMSPEFRLTDAEGNVVSSRALLARGPLVVSFYRGIWCPYCNIELQALEAVAEEARARGATLVAISPQDASSSRSSQRENRLSYPILIDHRGEVANDFGLRWTVQDYVIQHYRAFQVELPVIHGDGQWNLPMPARYVIGRNGSIAYAEVNPDYTQRPEPSDLFPILDQLMRSAA